MKTTIERVTLVAIACVLCFPAHAVTDEEIFRNFPFNLQNPGARALGIGGAFISLADDSTAAQANPAGLVQLRRPELFAELRAAQPDSSLIEFSVPFDTPTFVGTISAGAGSDPSSQTRPSFISYVLPRETVSFGFSRMESLNVQTRTVNSFELVGERAVFGEDSDGNTVIVGTETVDQESTSEADASVRVEQYNVAMAFDITRGLSFGITGVVGRITMNGRVDNLYIDRAADPSNPIAGLTILDYATRIDDQDMDVSFNAGLLWQPGDSFSFGAVYRRGHRFEIEQTVPDTGLSAPFVQNQFGSSFQNIVRTPDSYGFGVSYRPSDPLTFFVDALQIEYSDLLDGYQAGLNRITFPDENVPFEAKDGTEVHLGVEYLLLSGKHPIALRAGAWSDPDSRIHAGGREGFELVFPEGERVTHATAGFGMTFNQSIQLDLAVDISSDSSTMVASSIYRF